jgi:acyl-CoA synthetase (AMP-forming)/AMP-acid ligase II/acyl carrier protein
MPDTMSALRPLRRWLVGGEGLPADLAVTLAQSIDGELVNMYGPTETTVWSTTHKVVVSEVRTGTVDIGRPIANTQVYILDRNRQPVPAGVYGELYIGGDGVARGYWRRPELTKERFVEHPLAPHGTRIYRTGDLARYRTDGVIEFLGRADHQVKVRGHRIELGEIEAVLATHPGVGQSVVVVRTDNPDNPQLVAYVVPASQGTDAAALKDCLRAKLPGHMVPDGFVFLERLPLTPNGKIDRNALPAPERAPALRPRGEATAFVGMEKAIADIWKDLLAIDHLGADDNFFDLGGRSLQVVQMKSRLKQSLEVDLPVVTLFQYPTVRSLADFIGAESGDETFLSKIQERTRRRRNALAGRQHNYEETNA